MANEAIITLHPSTISSPPAQPSSSCSLSAPDIICRKARGGIESTADPTRHPFAMRVEELDGDSFCGSRDICLRDESIRDESSSNHGEANNLFHLCSATVHDDLHLLSSQRDTPRAIRTDLVCVALNSIEHSVVRSFITILTLSFVDIL